MAQLLSKNRFPQEKERNDKESEREKVRTRNQMDCQEPVAPAINRHDERKQKHAGKPARSDYEQKQAQDASDFILL